MTESLPTRGAWIEISGMQLCAPTSTSLPTRGAWIEIRWPKVAILKVAVAPHTGSVD